MSTSSIFQSTLSGNGGGVVLSPEAEAIYRERLREQRQEANAIFYWLMPAQWAFGVIMALIISPRAWDGISSSIHPHFWAALLGGALLASAPMFYVRFRPNSAITPHIVAVAQMLFSALFIHLTGGRIETHFHVFGSLAILAAYLDRSVLITAGTVVVVDHLLRGFLAPQSVYGVGTAGWWRSLEHGGWVVFETFFLVHFTQRTVTRTFRLAAQAAATQQALKDGEHRMRLVLETAYDAFVAMDAKGMIVGWNEQAERTFGWSRAEVLGHSLSERIIPVRFRAAHERGLQRFLETGEVSVLGRRTELSAMHRDGREIPVEITISAVRWGDTHLFNAFLRDITERRQIARQHEEMNRQLVAASRQAGKAEVAVGVLHNVGNVLNSVNVSAGIISDTIRASKVDALAEVVGLLRSQNGALADFLTNDPRGQLVPELLGRLTDGLRAEQAALQAESSALVSHIGHIRETVAVQQSNATVSGILEKLAADVLIDEAIKLEGSAMVRHGIEVVREFDEVPPVIVDRHKTLQVLVNLLRNAKQAMAGNDRSNKRLTLGISQQDGGPVRISVRDNGMGIAPENLSRIFIHGFTTKGDGHGFGLHISALAAREMGGTLTVKSDGPGSGALFTLELPLAQAEQNVADEDALVAGSKDATSARCPFSPAISS
jgi:PAS domain S-box-containing protein